MRIALGTDCCGRVCVGGTSHNSSCPADGYELGCGSGDVAIEVDRTRSTGAAYIDLATAKCEVAYAVNRDGFTSTWRDRSVKSRIGNVGVDCDGFCGCLLYTSRCV